MKQFKEVMNGGEEIPTGEWRTWPRARFYKTVEKRLFEWVDENEISRSVFPSGWIEIFLEVTELDLSNKGLDCLTDDIKYMNLKRLDLSGNQLIELPESIGELENLTHLYIKGNPLKTIPENLKNKEGLIIDVEI